MKYIINILLIIIWILPCSGYSRNFDDTGAIIDQSKNIDDDAKYFYLNQLRDILNRTNEFQITDIEKTDTEYAFIKRKYSRISKDYSEVAKSMHVRYIILSKVIMQSKMIKIDISVYDQYTDDFIFTFMNSGIVDKFSDMVQLFEGFNEQWVKNKAIISLTGTPVNVRLLFYNKDFVKLPISELVAPVEELSFNPGEYSLSLHKRGYRSHTFKKSFSAGNKHRFQYTLVPHDKSKARKYALIFPGLGHSFVDEKRSGKKWKRVGTGVVLATALSYYLYLTKSQAYDDLYKEYSAKTTITEIDEARLKLPSAMDARNQALSILATASATTLVTWIWNYFDLNRKLEKL